MRFCVCDSAISDMNKQLFITGFILALPMLYVMATGIYRYLRAFFGADVVTVHHRGKSITVNLNTELDKLIDFLSRDERA